MSTQYKRGDHDSRPWGTWEVLDSAENFCVKRICVIPGGKLSLQLHHHRAEHWIIVKGLAKITLGEQIFEKQANESVYIPAETKHRIENATNSQVEFIEVQTGENLDENLDFLRFLWYSLNVNLKEVMYNF